ncbi:MAG: hypothetical protein R3D26_24305 [Cyanobacteriota/Melainabacteria group bacterium]
MNAEEAKKYGLIDSIIKHRSEPALKPESKAGARTRSGKKTAGTRTRKASTRK